MKLNQAKIFIRLGIISLASAVVLFLTVGYIFTVAAFLAAGAFLLILGFLANEGQRRPTNKLLNLGYKLMLVVLILGIISFLVAEVIIIKHMTLPDDDLEADYLLILGGGLKDSIPSIPLQTRLEESLIYLTANPDLKAIVSGGIGRGEQISEAQAMKGFLVANGISSERIIKEEEATSTAENMRFSKELLERLEIKQEEINLLTSEFHMFRSRKLAENYGWQVYELKAKTPFWVRINYLIREYFALLKTCVFDLQ